jgi:hypothetical protein
MTDKKCELTREDISRWMADIYEDEPGLPAIERLQGTDDWKVGQQEIEAERDEAYKFTQSLAGVCKDCTEVKNLKCRVDEAQAEAAVMRDALRGACMRECSKSVLPGMRGKLECCNHCSISKALSSDAGKELVEEKKKLIEEVKALTFKSELLSYDLARWKRSSRPTIEDLRSQLADLTETYRHQERELINESIELENKLATYRHQERELINESIELENKLAAAQEQLADPAWAQIEELKKQACILGDELAKAQERERAKDEKLELIRIIAADPAKVSGFWNDRIIVLASEALTPPAPEKKD